MSPLPVVVARRLGRQFGHGDGLTVALADADFDMHGSEFVGVTGPSGCGKSTLLNLVGLLDRPTSGTLAVAGDRVETADAATTAARRRASIGFLFQDAGLIPGMSALANIALPLRYGGATAAGAHAVAGARLAEFGLQPLRHRRVETLSGGERQRIALIRALTKAPALLVCDEPTAALDDAGGGFVADVLAHYAAAGGLVLCSTHDPIVMRRLTRRIVMARGRLVAS